jgi:multicomponent Na+:H+ antiporter subunit A
MHLALWHGVDPKALAVMGLSLVTLVLGWSLYRLLRAHLAVVAVAAKRACAVGPERLFELLLDGVMAASGAVTRWLQNGLLRHYLLITLAVLVVVAGLPLRHAVGSGLLRSAGGFRLHEAILLGLLVAGAALAVVLRSRLAAVAALGVTGMAMALLFVLFGAPDLALTQIVVEVLTVILLVLVFLRLAPIVRRSSPTARVRDAAVAAAAGLVAAVLVLAAAAISTDGEVSRFFLRESQPSAHGRNVVNVILVDFRAMDTLGEITVLATAGVGVYALMRQGRRRREDG